MNRENQGRMPAEIEPQMIDEGAAAVTPQQVEQVARSGQEIDDKFARSALSRFATDARLSFLLVRDYWSGRYQQVPWWIVASVVFSLLYVLSPLDLIPDFVPVLGLMDDAAVFAMCVSMIERDLASYVRWRRKGDDSIGEPVEVGEGEGI